MPLQYHVVSGLTDSSLRQLQQAWNPSQPPPVVELTVEIAPMRATRLRMMFNTLVYDINKHAWMVEGERPDGETYPEVLMAARNYHLSVDVGSGQSLLMPLGRR